MSAKSQSRSKRERKRHRPPPPVHPRVIRPAAPRAPPLPRPLKVGERPGVDELAAYSIPAFCWAHNLSISMFHKLRSLGLAPRIMEVGARRMISVEEAARWRAERERSAS